MRRAQSQIFTELEPQISKYSQDSLILIVLFDSFKQILIQIQG